MTDGDRVTVTLPWEVACEVEETLAAHVQLYDHLPSDPPDLLVGRLATALALLRVAMRPAPLPGGNVVPLSSRRRPR